MQRTICTILEPSSDQAGALRETADAFTSAFNQAVSIGWKTGISNKTKLHYEAYYSVKAAHPTLVSDLINQARVKAAEALRSAFALKRKGKKVSQSTSHACPPRYNKNTYKVDWASRTVRMSTARGRQTIRFAVPAYAERYTGGLVDTADLLYRNGKWLLHVVVTLPTPEIQQTGSIVGVDLGLAHPAVTSDNRFHGKRAWKDIEGRYFKLRRALQSRGTKSAKRHLRKMRGRQRQFRKDCDHVLSRRIVDGVEPGSTIILENLVDIRKRIKARRKTANKRRLHSWSFAQLQSFIRYKAEERGCTVAGVDPRHTSQRCSACGHTQRNNRRSQSRFKCRVCGFELHADLNASRNIAAKYRASRGISSTGGLPVNQPIAGPVDPSLKPRGGDLQAPGFIRG